MVLCIHLGLKLLNYSLGNSVAIRSTMFDYNLFTSSDDVTYWVHTGQFHTPPSQLYSTCTLKSRIWKFVKACLYLLVFCALEMRSWTCVTYKVSYRLLEWNLEKLLNIEEAKVQTGLLRY